ncbi:MAG TPA: MarR family winged helix-turn-helix transcriptional regulator [Acidiphilium sp.]
MLELDRFTPYLVNRLASRLSDELAEVYAARFGISIPEWRVIAHLSQHRNISVREIHALTAMDKSKVSRAVARLDSAGLVEKKVSGVDRRLVELRLTRKGRQMFEQIDPLALAYERDALSALSPDEERQFRALVDKLLAPRG